MNGLYRIIIGTIALVLLISVSLSPARAHLPGQMPFFRINGVYSTLYPVLVSSVPDFVLPQDSAPDVYLVNTPIEFEIDVSMLPFPPEIASNSSFLWDYGDGTTGVGLKNTYAYQNIGSYILSIDIQDPTGATQLLQSVVLNIVPDKGYKLPRATITVNGKVVKDPLVDTVNIDQAEEVMLTANTSEASTDIVEYYWDLGDREQANGQTVIHNYNIEEWMFFPVLRIKDKNGFIADTFVQINNGIEDTSEKKGLLDDTKSRSLLMISGGIAGIIAVGVFLLLRRNK